MNKPLLERVRKNFYGFTFDDLLIVPGFSKVLPDCVSVRSNFTRNIPLFIPIASAAMDTVTEYEMAIELAKLGGIGIIHKNLTPEQQASQVASVKHSLNGYIDDPKFVYQYETVRTVLDRITQRGYKFNRFPVLNKRKRLVGVVTRNDFDFCDKDSRTIKEIMTLDPLHIVGECSIEEAYHRMIQNKKKILPVADSDGKLVGAYVFSDVKRILNGNVSGYNVDSKGRLVVGAAIGVINNTRGNNNRERLERLVEENVDVIVIDTAHGHSEGVGKTLNLIKKLYPKVDVVAGNVATGDGAKYLADNGADAVKVGIGPGSICTTRVISGVGVPQISAIYESTRATESYKNTIIADGGLRYSGDLVKAICAGAHCAMMGGILAGTKESPGEEQTYQGRLCKVYRGMGSLETMQAGRGSRERYSQDQVEGDKLVPEGVGGLKPYQGEVKGIVAQFIGGLRAGMGYVGAKNINQLRTKAQFIEQSRAGITESHPHDIVMTHDQPNYRSGVEI